MHKKQLYPALAIAAALGLSACAPQPGGYQVAPTTDTQRAVGGAVVGALAAKALDEDLLAGAAAGAAGGALCDDVGVCQGANAYPSAGY